MNYPKELPANGDTVIDVMEWFRRWRNERRATRKRKKHERRFWRLHGRLCKIEHELTDLYRRRYTDKALDGDTDKERKLRIERFTTVKDRGQFKHKIGPAFTTGHLRAAGRFYATWDLASKEELQEMLVDALTPEGGWSTD